MPGWETVEVLRPALPEYQASDPEAPAMEARLVTCVAPGEHRSTDLFETVIRPLVNAERPSRFKF